MLSPQNFFVATGAGRTSRAARPRRMARKIWRALREWCGDAAYERYLKSHAVQTGSCAVLSPEQFYVDQLNRRYSRPNRCC
jgi:uncharacterized short protein YbdD (DUF466 family)